ncbi:hypothetical protein [Streptomyces sp. SPB074]|uniref:hypothetical protein n=1 Tax=Streptomyces sp. (strain SPB074) TaxID=465543 RepID=UPI00131A3619|nr:hypothetical protein [Streptomyces sp. SPB074]
MRATQRAANLSSPRQDGPGTHALPSGPGAPPPAKPAEKEATRAAQPKKGKEATRAAQPKKGKGHRSAKPRTPASEKLSLEVKSLCAASGLGSSAEVITAVNEYYPGVQPPQFSRYRNGVHTPPEEFLRALHLVARQNCVPGTPLITLDELCRLREKAAKSRSCESCDEAWATVDALTAENRELRERLAQAGLDAETDGEGDQAGGRGERTEDGRDQTGGHLGGHTESPGGLDPAGQLPSPRQQTTPSPAVTRHQIPLARASGMLPVGGDIADRQHEPAARYGEYGGTATVTDTERRQVSAPAPAAGGVAGDLVRRVLAGTGEDDTRARDSEAALSLVLDAAPVMSPLEMCDATALLYAEHEEALADALVVAFAREQELPQVMAAALAFQRADAAAGLTLLLTTATRWQT